jgi:hypothetical protein
MRSFLYARCGDNVGLDFLRLAKLDFNRRRTAKDGDRKTLRTTPAMAANVTKRLWEIGDIVDVLEGWEASRGPGHGVAFEGKTKDQPRR